MEGELEEGMGSEGDHKESVIGRSEGKLSEGNYGRERGRRVVERG